MTVRFRVRALAIGVIAAPVLAAQQPPPVFDVNRAYLPDSTRFTPFLVTTSRPLRSALDDRTVSNATPLLVVDGRLALSTEQMTFHHAAQGDFAGEPWMVSF